ncbi:TraB/GumN family protein [Rhizobium sp. SSA_523]|uniref:TraB/GumN family protein n=1 Tax=Rhizobium sp. SSA_523 TaxID=2952477 RepID=UPI002090C964|nr:TraB/GumN family protein [Rhizobium sp. SSA_523]MCO5733596.1 TraB/GumN family protein [Rhizobium sp. SSA_523]WKC23107.1 TraB/GumN family protein [Rhizobium sp. SSA_523]
MMFRTFIPTRLASQIFDLALWALAGLHLLLLLSFLLILGALNPAGAAQDDACRGTDLLAAMRAEDPAGYARLQAEAAEIENGNSIFWKIEKPGLAASYLLGTMHVTDPRVLAMPDGAKAAAAAARVIIVESDEILDENKAMAKLLAKPQLTMMTDGRTIEHYLTPQEKSDLEAGLKARGIPLAAVSRMQPWMLSSFLALSACELARKTGGADFLDKQIAEDAAQAGRQVQGLETMEEQLEAIASIPTDFHVKSLLEMVRLGDRMTDVTTTMTDLYLKGEIGMMMPMLKVVAPDSAEGEGYAQFEERVVTDRNHRMAERALPLLAEGGAFIAVGALHLTGDQGLVTLLRKAGYTLTPDP